MTKVEPGQLWEWKNGAFTGTRFLVMEVNHHPADPKREDWSSLEIREFVDGGLILRTVTMTALLGGAKPL